MGIGCAMRVSEGGVWSSAVCSVRGVEYNTYIHTHVCMYVCIQFGHVCPLVCECSPPDRRKWKIE